MNIQRLWEVTGTHCSDGGAAQNAWALLACYLEWATFDLTDQPRMGRPDSPPS